LCTVAVTRKETHSSLNSGSSTGHFLSSTYVCIVDMLTDELWLGGYLSPGCTIILHPSPASKCNKSHEIWIFSQAPDASVVWFLPSITYQRFTIQKLCYELAFSPLRSPSVVWFPNSVILQGVSFCTEALHSKFHTYTFRLIDCSRYFVCHFVSRKVLCDCTVLRYQRLSWSSLAGLILCCNCRTL